MATLPTGKLVASDGSHLVPTVPDDGHQASHLQRSGCEVGLADGELPRRAGVPAIGAGRLGSRRDLPRSFASDIDAGGDTESQLPGPMLDRLRPIR